MYYRRKRFTQDQMDGLQEHDAPQRRIVGILAIVVLFCGALAFCGLAKAENGGADRKYTDPRCATGARYEAMAAGADCFNPPRDAEEPARPFYCKAFEYMDRSCLSVRVYVKMYGVLTATRRARTCGATENDIEDALKCIREPENK